MAEVWPATVTEKVLIRGYSEAPEDAAAVFDPEIGPAMTRQRTSMPGATLRCNAKMTTAEVAIFDDFYRNTVMGQALAFTRTHPRLGTTATFKFAGKPTWTPADRSGRWNVSYSLVEVP